MKRIVMAVSVLAVAAMVACGGSKESQKSDNPNPNADQGAAAAGASDGGMMMGDGGAAAGATTTP